MLFRENVLHKDFKRNYNNFQFEEISNIPKINLRGDVNNKNFVTQVGKILNTLVPVESNSSNSNNKLKIIWLSPNEWLIKIYDEKDFFIIIENLHNSLDAQNTAITDVTESRTILKLQGSNLYKLLSKFMIIDLDKALNKESSVAQTIFAKVPILIERNFKNEDIQNIYLHTNRSHAKYVINLLEDGSKNIDF